MIVFGLLLLLLFFDAQQHSRGRKN